MTMKLKIQLEDNAQDVIIEQYDYSTQQEADDGDVIISPDLLVDQHRIRGRAGNYVEVYIHYGRKVVIREAGADEIADIPAEILPVEEGAEAGDTVDSESGSGNVPEVVGGEPGNSEPVDVDTSDGTVADGGASGLVEPGFEGSDGPIPTESSPSERDKDAD